MEQLTILSFFAGVPQVRKFKQLPQCIACHRKYSEKEFAVLTKTGHNIVWNIDYAQCAGCGKEVQGWLA